MKKRVWIMNHYAGAMYFDKGGRHYNFAKYLKRAGYEPAVFCANSRHGLPEQWIEGGALWQERTAEETSVPFVFVKTRTYTGNGKQRVLNMADFYRNVKKAAVEYAGTHGKPDVIYASSVHPLTLVAGLQLAKRFGVKCVCEVRDLWPETIVTYGWLRRNSLTAKLLYTGEKWLYKKADRLIFTMEGAYDYIAERGWEKAVPQSKVFFINNGVDIESFDANREHFRLEDPDLEDPDTFKLIYTGSIRMLNGLSQLVDCAERFRDHPEIHFLVYGGGDDLETLRETCRKKGLANLVFKGPVEKKYVPYILSKGNVNLVNYVPESVKFYRFGNSQNKLFEYLASGKPILTNVKLSYNPADRRSCCYASASPLGKDYAEAVLALYRLPSGEYETLCRNARKTAEEYDFINLTKKLIDVIES